VKHLGNPGGHPGKVVTKEMFDGLDILERILQDIYSKSESRLARVVKVINKPKGPRRAK
jgi:hypothetical protein